MLTTNIWLDQEWIDEFLTWNASDYGNITRIRVPCTGKIVTFHLLITVNYIFPVCLAQPSGFQTWCSTISIIPRMYKGTTCTNAYFFSFQHGCHQCRRLYERLHVQSCYRFTNGQCLLATADQAALYMRSGRHLLSF